MTEDVHFEDFDFFMGVSGVKCCIMCWRIVVVLVLPSTWVEHDLTLFFFLRFALVYPILCCLRPCIVVQCYVLGTFWIMYQIFGNIFLFEEFAKYQSIFV